MVIEFKEAQYSRVESNLEIPVIVQKTEIRLAHPLTLRVQPMTIAEALARGLHIPLVDGVDITVNNTEERRRVPIRAQGKHDIKLILPHHYVCRLITKTQQA